MSTDISLTSISTKLCFAQVSSNALSIFNYDSIDSSANDTGSGMYVSDDTTTDTQILKLNMGNINIISNNILSAANYDVNSSIYLLNLSVHVFVTELTVDNNLELAVSLIGK